MTSERDRAILDSIFNPYLPLGEGVNLDSPETEDDVVEDESDLVAEVKQLELQGVMKAEAGQVEEAVRLLTQALQLAPERVATLNNRAQAYRLLGDDDAAMADLSRAVGSSSGHGRARAQALCQRALINRQRGQHTEALQDLQAAAELGSHFAKQLLVQTNPYAAMCNQMLHQVFTKLKSPSE